MNATYTATRTLHPEAPADTGLLGVRDPWRALCEFCPLPDCVRYEGEFQPLHPSTSKRHAGCLITEAELAGQTPEEALEGVGRE